MNPEPKTCEWVSFHMDGKEVLCGQKAVAKSLSSKRHYCEDHYERFQSGRVPFIKLNESKN